MSTIFTVQDLHRRFGNRVVLKGVSFAVGDRDRIGPIGANGSGKSTLLKMIVKGAGVSESEAALLEPDEGQIGATSCRVRRPGAAPRRGRDHPRGPGTDRGHLRLRVGIERPFP